MLNRVFQVALRVSNRQGRTTRPSNSTTKFFSRTPRSSSSPSAVYSRLRLILFATRLMSKFAKKRQNSERASRRRTITLSRILRRRSRPKEPTRTSSAPSETKKHGRRRFETRTADSGVRGRRRENHRQSIGCGLSARRGRLGGIGAGERKSPKIRD